MTLIERTVRAVRRQGVERVVVALGHDEAKVAEAARAAAPDSVEIVRAQGWESGNGSSLAAAKLTVSDESLFLLLVGDHLYGDAALDPLVTVGGTAALLDPHPLADVLVEATRVVVEDRTAVRFGRASRCCCPAHGCPPTWTWLAFALGVVAGALLALGAGAGGSTGDARRLRPGRRRRRAGPAPTAGQPRGPYSKASSTAWPTSPRRGDWDSGA